MSIRIGWHDDQVTWIGDSTARNKTDSPVAQLVEHSKINREALGLFLRIGGSRDDSFVLT